MASKQPPMPGLRTAEDANPPRLPKPTAEESKPDIRTALFGCPHRDLLPGGRKRRNLIVNLDGTSNQFSVNSTNVVELFSRIIKSGGDVEQLVYYNSGIGTYARPSFRSFSYLKQALYNHIDTAIAWNFERIVHAAYKWLSENYEPGDRIFLFGFSRGAYQVRVIAGMIEMVGLLHKGNENQIAFAYELYTAVTAQSERSPNRSAETRGPHSTTESNEGPTFNSEEEELCWSFKQSLCHEDVKVHFVGAWDTVSSIGVFRGKSLPETVSGMGHVCHFRHALALDERRAKFQPEYVNGGLGPIQGETRSDVKEVWFKGTHSDIGGGNIQNKSLNNFSESLRWMTFEAQSCGLLVKPYTGKWVSVKPKESLTWFWMLLELLPFGALAYIDKHTLTWWLIIIEQDPFQNASHILNSLSQACDALESGQGDRGAALTTLTVGIQTLQSFLDDPTRLSSLLEVRGVDNIFLRTIILVVQDTTITLSLESKKTLVRLFAHAWDLTNQIFRTSIPRPLTYQVYQWGLEVRKTHRDDLFKVLQPFALIAKRRIEGSIGNVTFLGADPSQIIFTRNLSKSGKWFDAPSIWGGPTRPAKDIVQCRGYWSCISRDGSCATVVDGRDISIINTTIEPPLVIKATDEEEDIESGDINSPCFSDDHQTLACGHQNGWIKLWRREEDQWKVLKRFKGGDSEIWYPAFSRDGSRLVFKISDDGPAKLWSLADDSLMELDDSKNAGSLAWSPSGDWVVVGTMDGEVKIWTADRGKIKHTFKAHDDRVWCLAFRHDGQVLATGSYDYRIRIWSCRTWEKIWEFDVGRFVRSLAFSPDGKRLISGSTSLYLWDVDMGDIEDTA
ncbi:hypothetical protein ONZ45_g12088 [Pleurotus djamor]|nr:hypothetical protein ONZ45_g12088 [Pleurotus djamor]